VRRRHVGRRQLPETFAAFAHARYRRVWAAGFISQLGDWMQIVGRSILAYRLTGRAESLGIVYFATYLPQMLFSPWAGVLVDRFDRRHLMVVTQCAQAAGSLVLGVLVATGTASVANVALISFAIGVPFMLAIPTQQALAPAVVPREALTSAINLSTATNSVTRVIGPLLASGVIAVAGLQWVFWVNGVSFAAVILAWLLTPVERQPPLEETRSFAAMREALRFVRDTPSVLVPIVATSFFMVVGLVYQVLAVVYATDVLAGGRSRLGQTYYGWLQAAVGVGAAVAILALAGPGRRRPGPVFAATAMAFAAALVALGTVDSIAIALVLMLVCGGFHFANMALGINLVQHEVPEAMRGRVMAIHMLGLVGMVPFTALGGAALADAIGIDTLFVISGSVCLAFSLLLVRWGRHLRVMEVEPESAQTRAAIGALLEEEA
jgi:MFS family permease